MQQDEQGSPTWRELLGSLDMKEKRRIINSLGIQGKTLERWIRGQTELPHPGHIRQLLIVLPAQTRTRFIESLQQDPHFSKYAAEIPLPGSKVEIPLAFYSRVIEANVTTPAHLRLATIHQIVLTQIVRQLDFEHRGILAIILKCTPPAHGNKVRTLHHLFSLGASPWDTVIKLQNFFLGAESLAGQSVMKHELLVIQDIRNKDDHPDFQPLHLDKNTVSVAALLLQKDERIAGCLLICSTQPHFFTPDRLAIARQYRNLLVVAISDGEFYEQQQIELSSMPPVTVQREYLIHFHKRVSSAIKQAQLDGYSMQWLEAEQEVRQHIEAELIERAALDRTKLDRQHI
jgi:hypothetical protein